VRESDGEHKCLGETARGFRKVLRAFALPLMMTMNALPADGSRDITRGAARFTAPTASGPSNGLTTTVVVTTVATVHMIA